MRPCRIGPGTAPNNDLISGPTSVSIDLANTEFVMLIRDSDGTAGDVNIGAAHELDILFDPDDPALTGNWVWNNMPNGTPNRFADPSPQAVIYRTRLTHSTDPYLMVKRRGYCPLAIPQRAALIALMDPTICWVTDKLYGFNRGGHYGYEHHTLFN